MYWWVNILALLLMIAILKIDPAYLEIVSLQVASTQLQFVSYIAIFITLILWLLKTLIPSLSLQCIPPVPSILSSDQLSKQSYQRFIVPWSLNIVFILSFFAAIFASAIAQRLYFAEQSVDDTVYVDAIVTPIGLSDRQFEFNDTDGHNATAKPSIKLDSTRKLTQGYRLLAYLSEVHVYDKVTQSKGVDQTIIDNPFYGKESKTALAEAPPSKIPPSETASKQALTKNLANNMTVLLTSFDHDLVWLNTLQPTQQVRMKLALKPLEIKEDIATDDFNEYRWLSSRHATAKATVIKAEYDDITTLQPTFRQQLEQHRYDLRQHLQQLWINDDHNSLKNTASLQQNSDQQQVMAVTLSLLTGDRSLINKETTALYRFAGISHLLAISGAHVLFLAILAAWLASKTVNILFPFIYQYVSRWQLQLIVAVIVAFTYALFAGFDVPAARTAWMLLLIGGIRYLLLARSTFKILLGLATFMAWQDIFVLWQAGFWLSFMAVALLVAYTYRQQQHTKINDHNDYNYNDHDYNDASSTTNILALQQTSQSEQLLAKAFRLIRQFILLQIWMSLALLPISLWLFGKVSLWGLLVNIFAIGFFGWIIVPLNLLAGLLSSFIPTVADTIWHGLFWLLGVFHGMLGSLQATVNQSGWIYTAITLPILLTFAITVLPWLLPKGILSRLLTFPASVLLLLLITNNKNIDKNTLVIYPLVLQDSSISALLLSSQTDNWLLLSAYPNSYKTYYKSSSNNNNSNNDAIHDDNVAEHATVVSTQLYDELMRRNIDTLTGVIVQTPTPLLAATVMQLKDNLPLHHYWQAGNRHQQAWPITKTNSIISLTARPCEINQSWSNHFGEDLQSNNHNKNTSPYLSIKAVTGWQTIPNKTLWNCALQITTDYEVTLANAASTLMIPLSPTLPTSSHSRPSQTQIIVNSSQDAHLWQLWQLMCPADSDKNNHNLFRSSGSNPLSRHHWLTSKPAYLNKALVKHVHPSSLHIVGDSQISTTSEQSSNALYWQRIINELDTK